MRTSISGIFSVIFVFLILGCSKEKDGDSEIIQIDRADLSGSCIFGTSTAPGPHCAASIFTLISNPEKYYGKSVYTYGYLHVSKGGDLGLSYEKEPRPLPDFFSCIDLGKSNIDIEDGVYAVAVFGVFGASHNNICAGKIEDPVIDSIERI